MSAPLKWHREYRQGGHKRVVTGVKAWATDLDPDATMPPYYRINQLQQWKGATRVVYLINCRSCGGDRIEICVESNLDAAKKAAQDDYEERLAQQSSH